MNEFYSGQGQVMKTINNVKVIKHKPYCTVHFPLEKGEYSEKYDSYYCKSCNRWLESKCDCDRFCSERPDTPRINYSRQIIGWYILLFIIKIICAMLALILYIPARLAYKNIKL